MVRLTKYLFIVLCLSLGKVHASSAGESTAQQTFINDIYRLQVSAYEASTLFHMYTLLEGDKQVAEDISHVVQRLNEQLGVVQQSEVYPAESPLSEIIEKFTGLVQANEIATEGYTSVYAINDMEAALSALQSELDSLLPQEVRSLQSDILSNAVLVRKIGSRYARLAAHWNARTGILADAEGDTIDIHTQKVSEQLAELAEEGGLTPEEKASVTQAMKKWRFIAPKLMDYQNDTVPYLVSRYSSSIANQLLDTL